MEKCAAKYRVVLVQIRIVQMAFDHPGLQAVGDGDVGYAAIPLIHPPVSAEPVCGFSYPPPPRQRSSWPEPSPDTNT